jgi:hypothetical protein
MKPLAMLPIVATVAALVILRAAVPLSVPAGPEVEAARTAIREAMDRAPYLVAGRLVAQDQDLPTEAMKLLKPNAVISRNYSDIARGLSYGFVMTHAVDLNDMVGHYPPICYPGAGWTREDGGGIHELDLGFDTVRVREYRFVRRSESGADIGVRVLNGFILPDGSTTTEMSDLRARAGRRALAAAGAAQLQMIVPAAYDEQQALDVMAAIIRSTEEAVRLMGLGGGPVEDADTDTDEADSSEQGRS